MEKFCLVLLFGVLTCHGAVHSRNKRETPSLKGSDELNYKSQPGYDAYYKAAKAYVKGDWMSKDIIIAKFWNLWGSLALDKIKEASDWRASKKDIPFTLFQDYSNQMDVDISQKDKAGRVILYQNMAKPNYIENSKDPAKVTSWLSAIDQIYQEASQKQVERWEGNKSEYTTIAVVYNYQDFDKEIYLCPVCINFGKDICNHVDNYFPDVGYKAFLVNASPEFELFWNLIKVVLSEASGNKVSVFSGGKEKWLPMITKYIDVEVVNKLIK